MKIDGHYDRDADVAWLRFESYNAGTVVSDEVDFGLREIDSESGEIVGLEYWRASATLPRDFLELLPSPPVGVAS